MKLRLFHGRKDPAENLEDWGTDGPILEGIKWVHTTYMARTVVSFETVGAANNAERQTGWKRCEADSLEITYDQDMIYADYRWYGDWSLFVD